MVLHGIFGGKTLISFTFGLRLRISISSSVFFDSFDLNWENAWNW